VEQLRPEVTPGVKAIVNRLMAKRPEDRFQTPAELAAALSTDSALPQPAVPVAVIVPAALAQDQPAPLAIPLGVPPMRGDMLSPSQRKRRLFIAAFAFLLLMVLVAVSLGLAMTFAPP
jgi:hypothetical protein